MCISLRIKFMTDTNNNNKKLEKEAPSNQTQPKGRMEMVHPGFGPLTHVAQAPP